MHSCQLDVDHIDGDHDNNDPENLQTLCANCHRLKTQIQKDYRHKNNG
jgi:5-methylcytosine-specific restriction endonuclease McrA